MMKILCSVTTNGNYTKNIRTNEESCYHDDCNNDEDDDGNGKSDDDGNGKSDDDGKLMCPC